MADGEARPSPAGFLGDARKATDPARQGGRSVQGEAPLSERYKEKTSLVKWGNEEGESHWFGWEGGYWQSRRRAFSRMIGMEVRV